LLPYQEQISEFLKALYGSFQSDQYLYLWTGQDRRTWCFPVGDLGIMSTAAEALQDERDVYFGIGTAAKEIPQNKRPKAKEVSCLPGFGMDIDIKVLGAHAKNNLPSTIEEALSILPDFLQPTYIVWTGNGLHIYWLFRGPWRLDSPEENQRAAMLSIRLQAYIKELARERGWHLDSTADLSRILRVPGTLNHKQGQKKPVYIVSMNSELRYDPTELEYILPKIDFKNGLTHHSNFEHRDSDASADLMIASCQFLHHCVIDADEISYGEWLSMLTNVVRGADGIEKCHELSSHDPDRYIPEDTEFKVSEALRLNPHTCEYIQATHGFKCPEHGCGVKAPCSFSLSKIDQARAKVNMIDNPSIEIIFNDEMLNALAIVKRHDAALYAKTKDKLKGKINLRDLEKAIKQSMQHEVDLDFATPPEGDESADIQTTGVTYPPNFKVSDSGVYFVKLTDNGPQIIRACGGLTVITARLYNQDTNSESLKIAYKYTGRWRDVVVPRSLAVDGKKVIALADRGVAVSSEGSKYLAKFYDEFLYHNPEIPVRQAVSRFGWRGQDFVFPGISPDVEIDIDDLGSLHALKGFNTAGTLTEWCDLAKTVRSYSPNARFILAAGFSTPLLKVLSQRNFIVHNFGNSQDGKTATLWMALSIWGEPNAIISSFDNTPTSLERRASLFSDLPMGINEREVLNQYKKQDISSILYMLGEGKGRGRGSKAGLQELNTWRTVVLTTGEGPLTNASSMDGLMTRTIELEGGPLAENKDLARELYLTLPECHGHAGIAFLQGLLSAERSLVVAFYREAQKWLRENYIDRIDSHLDALATVMTADYFANLWVFGQDANLAKSEAYVMGGIIAEKLILKQEASESERAWLEFMDWVGEHHEQLSGIYTTVKIGVREPGNIYIIRRVVNEFLGQYSSARKIIQAWADSGKIKSWEDLQGKKRFDVQKRLGGAKVRCIAFAAEIDDFEDDFLGVGTERGQCGDTLQSLQALI